MFDDTPFNTPSADKLKILHFHDLIFAFKWQGNEKIGPYENKK